MSLARHGEDLDALGEGQLVHELNLLLAITFIKQIFRFRIVVLLGRRGK